MPDTLILQKAAPALEERLDLQDTQDRFDIDAL
jgi:hypothetical protein